MGRDKLWDISTIIAFIGASVSIIDIQAVVSLVAGCVAIVSGVSASAYYINSTIKIRRENRNANKD